MEGTSAMTYKDNEKSILPPFEKDGKVYYSKDQIEFQRYKQDCRKRALEVAERTVSQVSSGVISDSITKEADIYYNWLISIPQ